MVQWAEICKLRCAVTTTAFEYAARSGSDSAIETLCRHGLDINDAENPGARTALKSVVSIDNRGATTIILTHGGKLNVYHRSTTNRFLDGSKPRQVTAVLLEHGANIESTDMAT